MTEAAERIKEARERDEAAAESEAPQAETVEAGATETAQPAQPTEKQIEKGFTDAMKSAERHVAKIAPLMGTTPDQVVPCPCCDFPGFVFAQRPPLEGERLMAVKAVIGEEDVRAYQRAENAVECEACNGYGKLVRPTKVADQLIATCPTCNGYGWHAPQAQVAPMPAPPQTIYYPPPNQYAPQNNAPPVYPVQPTG